RSTKEKEDSFTLNSRLTTAAFDYEYYSGEVSDQSSDSTDYCSSDDVDEVSDRTSSSSENEQPVDCSYFLL
ncbi:unnamed protein product, partial [Rotaria sordida]